MHFKFPVDLSLENTERLCIRRAVTSAATFLLAPGLAPPRSKKLRGERKAETNASTLVGVTSHVTVSAKIHCK